MSSIYDITLMSNRSPRTLFISAENDAGAFDNPKGKTVNSNNPYLVLDFKFPILDGMVPFRRLLFKYLHVRKY
jgi:hypothetical protein